MKYGKVSLFVTNRHCYRTIFILGNMLVLGGYVNAKAAEVELIDVSTNTSKKCTNVLPSFPFKPHGQAIVLLKGSIPTVCGGYDSSNSKHLNLCHHLINNTWVSGPNLSRTRHHPSAFTIDNDGTSWMVVSGQEKGTDILSLNGSRTSGAPVPRQVYAGCSVKINSTTAITMAGHDGTKFPTDTHYYSIADNVWTPGPPVKVGRFTHACGLLQDKVDPGVQYVVMAGGRKDWGGRNGHLTSTEVLKVGTNEWIQGPDLPDKTDGAYMTATPDGQSLIFSGGEFSNGAQQKSLYRFQCVSGNCKWEKLPQAMNVARFWHTAIFVPESTFPCHEAA